MPTKKSTSEPEETHEKKGKKGGQAMVVPSNMSPLAGAAAGAIAGAALGAAAAAALSNKTVKEKVGDAMETVKSTASDVMDNLAQNMQEAGSQMSDKAQHALKEGKSTKKSTE